MTTINMKKNCHFHGNKQTIEKPTRKINICFCISTYFQFNFESPIKYYHKITIY